MEAIYHILLILVTLHQAADTKSTNSVVFRFNDVEACEEAGKRLTNYSREVYAYACVDIESFINK